LSKKDLAALPENFERLDTSLHSLKGISSPIGQKLPAKQKKKVYVGNVINLAGAKKTNKQTNEHE
jgi:hypothetical protein